MALAIDILFMYPPFPIEPAYSHCQQLISELDKKHRLDIDIDESAADENYSITTIKKDAPGFMIGVCVCIDTTGRTSVLKAFSGQYGSRWNCPGWCPPLLDPQAFDRCIADTDRHIHELSQKIAVLSANSLEQRQCIAERAACSRSSMQKIFDLYSVHCIDGTQKSYRDIFSGRMPPSGTGDCCAPKLLDYAFAHNLIPVSLAEVYYRPLLNTKDDPLSADEQFVVQNRLNTESWIRGQLYPPCDKCALILPIMLGLEIVYRDEHIIVVNKPSGLLSVPGRGIDKQDCVVNRVKRLFPQCMDQPSVHRLDMDTSGLLVLAFDAESHRNLSMQFMNGTVHKCYTAILDGIPAIIKSGVHSGRIVSRFRLDLENRPHQIYDPIYGKEGITDWELLSIEHGKTRVLFTPCTGRTHQLRLHSSHESGFGVPIIGDNLYGSQLPGERLMLHCHSLLFVHPVDGSQLTFSASVPF